MSAVAEIASWPARWPMRSALAHPSTAHARRCVPNSLVNGLANLAANFRQLKTDSFALLLLPLLLVSGLPLALAKLHFENLI